MFTKFTLALLASSALVYAAPAPKAIDGKRFCMISPVPKNAHRVPDTTILNYALTLEHLENEFYRGALAQFNEAAFTDAGLPASVRTRFTQIAEHEDIHVTALSAALGKDAVAPCKYSL